MPQVTTSVSLIGLREAAYYAIKCSAGTSIPVDEEGNPDGQVVLTFFRIDETGEYVSYVAPYIIVDYGGIANAYNYDKDSWDITSLVSSASGTTITVTVYEDTSASKVLASEVLSLIYPSSVDVEFPLELKMDGGSTAIFMTAYGEVKDGQDLLVTLEKGGEKSSGYIQYRLTMIDMEPQSFGSSIYVSSSGYSLKNAVELILSRNTAISKIDVRYWESGGETKEASFLLEYASPIPVPRTDAWSSGNTYRNGEFFIDESTNMVYMWVYPKAGNTSVKPSSYISAGTKPKRWEQVDLKYLIATEVLLARYGLVGKAVFYDEYMMSQQGVDNNGNESGNYTQYPSNFKPNFLINFLTGLVGINKGHIDLGGGKIVLNDDGSGHLAGGNFSWLTSGHRIVKAPEIVQWVKVTEYTKTEYVNGRYMKVIDYTKGSYLHITVNAIGSYPYKLNTPEVDQFRIALRNIVLLRSQNSATIYYSGGFKGYNYSTSPVTSVSGIAITLSGDASKGKEVYLAYDENEDVFVVENADCGTEDDTKDVLFTSSLT